MLFLLYIVKEDKPLLLDLQNLITPNYSSCWKSIGNQLGIPTEILDVMEADNPTNLEKCCNDMLKHWWKFDAKASWNKIVEAIDSPPVAAADLASRLKKMSIDNRFRNDIDNWPLASPKHFTSVALIHHKGQQTKQEILAVATLQTEGNFDHKNTDNDYFKQSKYTKDISDLFAEVKHANGFTKRPGIILIEGVPGIGKTILSKEIVFQWAKGKLLSDKTLVFLIYLRDIDSDKINSLESFVNYVSYSQVAKHILKDITHNKGKNVTIVFDGFDELSEKLRSNPNSFLYKLMTQKIIEIPYCNVVITSRPNASVVLHDKVDLRVEILGFTNEDRKAYIYDALNAEKEKADKILEYLSNNPAVDAYCYIPLNMTILLSIFGSGDNNTATKLPGTQTEINEKFICTTISRYIKRSKGVKLDLSKFSDIKTPCDLHRIGTPCKGHEKGVPYGNILSEICKLAFKALEKDKIVFTTAELQEACPCLEAHSDNWDGLGLLKAVQNFGFNNNLRNVSFNFLHFTVQEILAAHHITLMSPGDQNKCIEKTFWDNRYYNTWIMYVGLAKSQLPIVFKHFLAGNRFLLVTRFLNWWKKGDYSHIKNEIIEDKVRCLYLFQCFSEAENKDLCEYVGKLLQENKIDLSNQTLPAINLYTLSLFLARSANIAWNSLNLSNCFIGDNGIDQLYKYFTSNNRRMISIDTLNFSHNKLTQSSVEFIARLIMIWNVKMLEISFDDITQNIFEEKIIHQEMQQHMKHTLLNHLIVCYNKSVTIFKRFPQSKCLNISFNLVYENKEHRIKDMLTDIQWESLYLAIESSKQLLIVLKDIRHLESVDLSGNTMTEDSVSDMKAMIVKNKQLKRLCLPNCVLSQTSLKIIIQAMQTISLLKYVDFSTNKVDDELASDVAAVFVNNCKLKQVNFIELNLKHSGFQHLKTHLVNFKRLKHLSITDCTFSNKDLALLKSLVHSNNEIQELIISNCRETFSRFNHPLSYTTGHILKVLKDMKHLEYVDLSGITMTDDSVSDMKPMIVNNKQLQRLCLPNCVLNQTSLKIIIQAMQTISLLQYVDLSTNKVDNQLSSDVGAVFVNNCKLKQVNFIKLDLKQSGFHHLKSHFVHFKRLKHLSVTDCTFTNQDVSLLMSLVCSNNEIQELIITYCKETTSSGISRYYQPLVYNTGQILIALKDMRHLESVDLSGNTMTDDSLSDMEAMIVNNKQLQRLCLPNCVLSQTSLKIIVQAMQTISLLQYVDFSTNKVDNELASNVAAVFFNNCKLKQVNFIELNLRHSGFKHLKTHLVNFKRLKHLSITDCTFSNKELALLKSLFHSNYEIRELIISNCKRICFRFNQPLIYETVLLMVVKDMKCLECVDLSGNTMTEDSVRDMKAMIVNNKQLQRLCLPNCILSQTSLKIIVRAMQTISLLKYVDFSTNKVDDELASDVAALFLNNRKLERVNFAKLDLKQSGFHHLKTYLLNFKRLKHLSVTHCIFFNEDSTLLKSLVFSNNEIQELIISNCQRLCFRFSQPLIYETQQIMNVLKDMRHLECIDLSGNTMTDDSVSDMEAMIVNNKQLQRLCLPNCVLSQTSLKIIIQAMQTISLLKYVDFSTNKVDDELASDVAALFVNNCKLERVNFAKLDLKQSGFHHLKTHLVNFKRLKHLSIADCIFSNEDSALLKSFVCSNYEIEELIFSSCRAFDNTIISINTYKLKVICVYNCHQKHDDIKQILMVLKHMKYLECVDLSENAMRDDSVSDMKAMIVKNEQLQRLCLPNCVLSQTSLKIIIQAMQNISSLQYVDLSTNKVDDKLTSDIAALFVNNCKLEQVNFAKLDMKQSGFHRLKTHFVHFKRLKHLSVNDCTFINQDVPLLMSLVGSNNEIQELIITNCKEITSSGIARFDQPLIYETGQTVIVLKDMRYLECIDLSGNTMTDDSVSDMKAMIVNNKQLQRLCLPNCVLSQTSLKIIIRAMQTISLLQYVDFSTNKVDDELSSDIAALFVNNCKLEQVNFIKLDLNQNGFKHLKTHFVHFKRLKHLSVTDCTFTNEDLALLKSLVHSNNEIQELIISNCKKFFRFNQPLVYETRQILIALKDMRHLECVDLNGNTMTDDSVSDMEAMIINNKQLQRLCLPNCVLSQTSLKIIIQAMQTISLLQYVDFSTNKVDNELASDVAALFVNNCKLEQVNFTKLDLKQSGFHNLKTYLVIFKGLKYLNVTDCTFSNEDLALLKSLVHSNNEIRELIISNCKTIFFRFDQPLVYDTGQILIALKDMRHLECVDLSGNTMTDDSISNMEATIINNKQLQKLCLPNCVLSQTSLKIIIQAMQTISLLQYVDFSTNRVDDELASDIAALFVNNCKLEQVNFTKLDLKQSGFLHLKTHLVNFKRLKHLSITDCTFSNDDLALLKSLVYSNNKIRELIISNCKTNFFRFNQPLIYDTGQILIALKDMKHLECVDLSGNTMTDDSVSDMKAMIVNNKQLQRLCLPNCVLSQTSLKIIIQAMQTISLLQYIDFSTNKVDDELASDVAALFVNNCKLKQVNFFKLDLKQSGFQHLKMHLVNFKRLKHLSITDCTFSNKDSTLLKSFVCSNNEIQELIITNRRKSIPSGIARFNQPFIYKIGQILMVLKDMKHLECVDLRGNSMTNDSVSDIEAMIVNNKQLRKLCLPNCVFNQTSAKSIIQAMQNVSSLQYLDFSKISVDNELASDVSRLMINNSKLKKLNLCKLTLNQSGFEHLKNHLVKITGLKSFSITDYAFTTQDATILATAITINSKIHEISLSNGMIDIDQLLNILSCNNNIKLKLLNLSNCQFQSNDIKQILSVIKDIKYLQHVDLSANEMTSDAINEMATMIKNNKHIQSLFLPNSVFDQNDLRIIIQAMQTVSLLQYVDLNTNKVDDELASDVAFLISNNSKLRELKFSELRLNQSGFNHLKNYLVKIKGLKLLSITHCIFTTKDADKSINTVANNAKIEELNYKIHIDQLLFILSSYTSLEWLDLSNCQLQSNDIKQILSVIKDMKYLQHVDLSANEMTSDAINEIATMIKNNKHLQSLFLPNCVLSQNDLRIIIQALQTVSSLQYVGFNINKVDDELASDVALLIANNINLRELNISELQLNQSSFQYLKKYLVIIKGLKSLSITHCIFDAEDENKLINLFSGNFKIQELKFTNCRIHINQLLSILSYNTNLIGLDLSNCLFQSNEIKQILNVLKDMKYLQRINLSANFMTSDAINEMIAMIKRINCLQILSLPHCVLDQEDFRIIVQALQTISSLQYVDFSTNIIHNDLASDVGTLFFHNSKLKQVIFCKLSLKQSGFQHLKSHLRKVKGLKYLSITDCIFTNQDVALMESFIDRNIKIEELIILNCTTIYNKITPILDISKIQWICLCNSRLHCNETKQIIKILENMRYQLHCDGIGGRASTDDSVNNVKLLIFNSNKQLQKLCLPSGVLNQRIEYAIEYVSSLQSIECSTNEVEFESANNTFVNNSEVVNIKVPKCLSITDGIFSNQDVAVVTSSIKYNQDLVGIGCRTTEHRIICILDVSKLKKVFVCNYQLQSYKIKQFLKVLKGMKHLQCVDLSGNATIEDSIGDIQDMIVNNKQLKKLCLPKYVLDEKDIIIIIQALQTISSLQYVDFSTNKLDDKLASDVAILIANNRKLKQIKFSEVALSQSGYQQIKNYLIKIKGLTLLSITGCIFTGEDILELKNVITNNSEIQKINLSNCKMPTDLLLFIFSSTSNLKQLNLSNCQLQSNDIKQILGILKEMKYLQLVDLSANEMTSDAINDIATMIKNNEHIQSLSLPNCVLSQNDLRIIIQALQTVSSLLFVNFNTNKVENELASDIASIFDKNKFFLVHFTSLDVKQSGFQHLKAYLGNFIWIKQLSITECTFTNQDALSVVFLRNFRGLKYLSITDCSFTYQLQDAHSVVFLMNFRGLKHLSFTNCTFTNQDALLVPFLVYTNGNLEELIIANCKVINNTIISLYDVCQYQQQCYNNTIFSLYNVCQYQQQCYETDVLLRFLHTERLKCIDLSGNTMTDDSVSDMEAMIVNNRQLQKLCLPNCVLSQTSLKIIIQAMQTISLLQYVDFSTNKFDDELSSDIAALFVNNCKLEQVNFAKLDIKQSGFQHLKTYLVHFKELKHLSVTNCTFTNQDVSLLMSFVCSNNEIQELIITNCRETTSSDISRFIQPLIYKTGQILIALKDMRHLECVDLSGNTMTDDSVSDMEAMIVNNKQLQRLCLPNCVLSQTSLKIIIQAMQTISLLQYVDFSTNKVDNELASDVAALFVNCKLEQVNFFKLDLKQSGFHHLKTDLVHFKRLKHLSVTDCTFAIKDLTLLKSLVHSNNEIQKLIISNCKENFSRFNQLKSYKTGQLLIVLKDMRHLECVDLSGNTMTDDSVSDMEAMIVNNKQLQRLCLPNCVLSQTSLKIIIQAMQTISLLQYVDFSTNEVDDELASDVAALFVNNCKLEIIKFAKLSLKQIGFQHLKKYLVKFKGLQHLIITDFMPTTQDEVFVKHCMCNNNEIQELIISSCKKTTSSDVFRFNQPLIYNTGQLLIVLKDMRHLESVDLSGNTMTDDSVSDMEAMIVNNKQLQRLCLPNCVLSQTSLKIIIQAMQTVSLLRYVDFSTNKVDDELASDVGALFVNNCKLTFTKLDLKQNGFQLLKTHLVNFKRLKCLSIIDCTFTNQDKALLNSFVCSNNEIRELVISNCKEILITILSDTYKFNQTQIYETGQMLTLLKDVKHLECVDLSGNTMTDDSVSDMKAMIVGNKQLQKLCLPNWMLSQASLKIIIQAMQTISLLQYVDFSKNKVDDELASDITTLFVNNCKLEQVNFTKLDLKQSGFQHLKAHLVKFKRLKHLSITDCTFSNDDAALLKSLVCSNYEIQELIITNCKEALITTSSDISRVNQLLFYETKQILVLLKDMRHLECVDLSGNNMTGDSVSDMEAMIVNNRQLQKLCLPNCVLSQTSLKIIIQAMQTISLLQYVDFSTNKVDDELASDVAALFVNNCKLERVNFTKLDLKQNGFQHLKTHLINFKTLKHLSITDCTFSNEDAALLQSFVRNNKEFKELLFSNCRLFYHTITPLFVYNSKFTVIYVHNCHLKPDDIKQIFMVLRHMKHLECVDLSGNTMADDSVSDIEAMIVSNKQLQRLCLPNCVLSQTRLKIIIQAMQTISLLQYVDFSTNKVDDELASDVAALFVNNCKLEIIKFAKLLLKESGFQHLKTYLVKIKGLQQLIITDYAFTTQDVALVKQCACNNNEIQELIISSCKETISSDISRFNEAIFYEIGQLLIALKDMKHLEYVDLSGNAMTDDSVSDMEAMIVNNKQLQRLCLPNCVLSQTSLKIIIQAMQTISLLQYVDFSTNKVDDELASDVAALFLNNSKLEQVNFTKLDLKQSGFQLLKTHLVNFKGLKHLSIADCTFSNQDAALLLKSFVCINNKILQLIITNCKETTSSDISMLNQPQIYEARQILIVLKDMKHLECVDLSGNTMTDDSVSDMEAMIVKNKQLQRLCLPNCILSQTSLKIIIQAMQTISLLQYVDFSTNKVDDELASDVAALFVNNCKLEIIKFAKLLLKESGFQHLKTYLVKITGLQQLIITDYAFTTQDVALVKQCACNNNEIQELIISSYKETISSDISRFNEAIFYEIGQLLIALKDMKHLEYVDLSGNAMTDDSVSDMEAMIVNNKQLQRLCLPNCVLSQTSLKIIIQAMQTISLLQYVDFSTNKVDDELASDVAALFVNNCKLKQVNFFKLDLKQSGFQHLKTYLLNFKRLKHLSVKDCTFSNEDSTLLKSFVCSNIGIQELIILNCKIIRFRFNQPLIYTTRQIVIVLKDMRHLECVDLRGNTMTEDSVSDMKTMIVNNKQLQRLCLPNCVLSQTSLKIIIQAMQTISLLQYVDFSTNKVSDELASDVAALFVNNCKLEQVNFIKLDLKQSGFQHLKTHLVHFKRLKHLSITDCTFTNQDVSLLMSFVCCNNEIQELIITNCKEITSSSISRFNQPLVYETGQILIALKDIRYLECIDLRGNTMADDSVSDMEAMIVNNKQLQRLCLPNCVLSETSLKIIIQALQTISLLKYVDFSTNKVDDELASDVAALFVNNCKLEIIKFAKLSLKQSSFQHLKTYLVKIKGLQHLSITDCTFSNRDAVLLKSFVHVNNEIRELTITNCKNTTSSGISIYKARQILIALKDMKHLECIDLSENAMTDDSVSDMEAMIVNNKQLQRLCLPNCVLSQTSLKIIIQAMQTISLLKHVEFSTNKVDDELASDVAALFVNNCKLEQVNFIKLDLKQSGFQHLKTHLVHFKRLKHLSITDCTFTNQDVSLLMSFVCCNNEIQELIITNCKEITSSSISRFNQPLVYETGQILIALKDIRHLERVDLRGNTMTDDSVSDMEAMIVSNKQLQRLCLPNCVLSETSLKIIIQALQTISLLQYVDFSTNKVDDELASDVAALFVNNCKLEIKFAKLSLKQSSFQHLKTYLVKIKGLQHLSITDCTFSNRDAVLLKSFVHINNEIRELTITNCKNTTSSGISIYKARQILIALKDMKHLECIDLSGNTMTDDSVSDMEAMIVNNKQLQRLCLPSNSYVLNQASIRIILKALQTCSSLQYLDLSRNQIDNELSSDVHILFTNNSMLKNLHVDKLTLNESGFKHLKSYLMKFKGLTHLNLSNSSIIGTDVNELITLISYNIKLNFLILCNCKLLCNEIFETLKNFRFLHYVDLSGNTMTDIAFSNVELTIVNNTQLKKLCLPNCLFNRRLLKIIFDAMIHHSSFHHIDLSDNQVDCELVYDLTTIFCRNFSLEQFHLFKLVMNQSEFNYIKCYLKRIRSLHYLSIIDCELTEEDCNYVAIVAANNCNTLKEVTLFGCNVYTAGWLLIEAQLKKTCTFKY